MSLVGAAQGGSGGIRTASSAVGCSHRAMTSSRWCCGTGCFWRLMYVPRRGLALGNQMCFDICRCRGSWWTYTPPASRLSIPCDFTCRLTEHINPSAAILSCVGDQGTLLIACCIVSSTGASKLAHMHRVAAGAIHLPRLLQCSLEARLALAFTVAVTTSCMTC